MLAAVVAALVVVGILVLIRGGNDATIIGNDSETPVQAGGGYTVNLSPAGDVYFDRIPKRVVTMDANYNDMLVAVHQGEKMVATGYRDNFHDEYYERIDGLQTGYDPGSVAFLSAPGGGMFDKELLYALDADVHHIDPLQLAHTRGWSQADVDEITRNVAPFIANRYSRENSHPGNAPYTYYSLWQLSEKIAEVYQRPEAIRRLQQIGERMVSEIQAKLPAEDQRPRVGLVFYSRGKFVPYSLTHGGFGQAHYRDVGARDAFTGIEDRTYGASSGGPTGSPLDAEGLVSLDPDVLIMPFAIYPGNAHESYLQLLALKEDPLVGRVKAFENGRVYPGGTPLQGPVFYLFQLEMAAKQIYPEIFGEFRQDLAYPREEWLFDRDEVAGLLREDDK
ncbi:hypothetical protein Hsar01_01488 [Haloferula sargassicola]|uniref:Fe/B12 periplasmic-binding domain-containing protein n=2 Tax=Haloferula sargassicola TaxID=490096 RepID=A0ABP9UL72_9BACT